MACVVGAVVAYYPALSSYFLSVDFTVLDTTISKGTYLVWQPSQLLQFFRPIASATNLFSAPGKFNFIVVVSYSQLASPHSRVAVSREGDVYRFAAPDEGLSFDWSPGQLISATWEQAFDIIDGTGTSGVVRLGRLRAGDQVVYYSDDELIPISFSAFKLTPAHQ